MFESLKLIPVGPQRDIYLPFLRLAEQEPLLRDYYQLGGLYAFNVGGETVGTVLVLGESETREFKSVAVAERFQRQGFGQRMMRALIAELGSHGVRRIKLMTVTTAIDAIAFYQKVGFRMERVERDRFTAEYGYHDPLYINGILSVDAIWFSLDL